MITEQYVSFETARLLKEKGFRKWCFKCYGVAVLHNGVAISFDEECELKDEGRENEIEYVEGGVLYDCGCNNSDKDAKVWATPTQQMAMRWLREQHNLHIDIDISDGDWNPCVIELENWSVVSEYDTEKTQDTYEDAVEYALKYCLTKLL